MVKKLLLPLALLALVLMIGCTATMPYGSLSATEYEGGEFEVLGPVEGYSYADGLFGGMIVMTPDGGYQTAYKDALTKRAGANAIINTYSDVVMTQYVFGLYVKIETKVYGTAIKLNDEKQAMSFGD